MSVGVLSTTMSFLGLYRDLWSRGAGGAIGASVTWLMGFDHIALSGDTASDIARTKPLMRLVLNQIGRRLTESLDTGRRRQKLLLMLDEFAALAVSTSSRGQLAFMAGTASAVLDHPEPESTGARLRAEPRDP